MSKISYEIWKRQVSYDGENYIDMEGVYKIGEVIIGDVRCGDIQPIYRWYQYPITERYDCDETTHTKYQVVVYQVSYDRGITYQDAVPYQFKRSGDTISNSEDCGYTPPPEGAEYRWELMPIDSEYFDCDFTTHTKYQVRVYQVSYDKGVTWQNVTPYQFIRDGISTPNSEDCGYTPKPQEPKYRWQLIPITTDYDCDYETHTKYQIKVYQVSTDGGATWNDVVPRQIQRDGLIIENSEDCGYVEPIYEWNVIPIDDDYDCDDVNHIRYQIEKYQVSYDKGASWEDVEPRTIRRYENGIFYDNSEECGYEPIEDEWLAEEGEHCGHSIDSKEVVDGLYRTRVFSGHSYCDGERLVMNIKHQRSDDNGASWNTYKEETKLVQEGQTRCGDTTQPPK